MNTGRARFWTWILTGVMTTVIVACVILLARLTNVRIDLTEDQRYTLPAAAARIAASLDDTLTINVYLSKSLPARLAHVGRVLRNRLDEFEEASDGLIEYTVKDPADDRELEEELADLKMDPVPLRDVAEGKVTQANYYLWVEYLYKDQREQFSLAQMGQALLDPTTMMAALPYQLAARIVKVLHPDRAIGVVSEKKMPPGPARPGEQKKPTAGIDSFTKRIESHYQEVKDVQLQNGVPVRKDVTTLILYRPEHLSERAIYEIDQFLMRGNSVVVMVDNYSLFDLDKQQQFVQGLQQGAVPARPLEHGLKEWLAHYGFLLEDGYVEDESSAAVRRMVLQLNPLRQVEQIFPMHGIVMVREMDKDGNPTGQFSEESPVFTGLGLGAMIFPSPLQVSRELAVKNHGEDVQVNALIRTSPEAWIRKPEDGKVRIFSDIPGEDVSRGSYVLVAETHGHFKSFFADKEKPPRTGANGSEMPEAPNAPEKLEESVKPGTLWVFADGDFLSDWWLSILNPRNMRPILPSQEAYIGCAKMTAGLVNAMDVITFGSSDLVEIRKPILTDRSLRKKEVDEDKGTIQFWTTLAPVVGIVALGVLNLIIRMAGNRLPPPRRRRKSPPPVVRETEPSAEGGERAEKEVTS